jgi:sirohydrochlorin ferrochelatase
MVAHGDGGADPRDETVRLLAERLARRLDVPVDWATLKRPQTFDEARARLAATLGRSAEAPFAPVVVYPLFMAEGFFVRTKLPRLLAEHGFDETVVLPVFGLDPGLVDLLEHRLRSIASMQGGREPRDLPIALIAHGSGSGDAGSRRAAEAVAGTLRARLGADIRLGFIEEDPFYDRLIETERPAIVIGLFVSAGTHALDDVATAVARAPFVCHHVDAIGRDAGVADMVERAFRAAIVPVG